MELQIAIAEIDPKARYLLNHSVGDGTQTIIEWRGPGPQPTPQELQATWDAYEAAKAIEDAAEAQKEVDKQAAIVELSKTPEGQQILKAIGITPQVITP